MPDDRHTDLGDLMHRGRQLLSGSTEQDRAAAVECLLRAEQHQRVDAAYMLASISLGGLLLPRHLDTAARRIEAAVAGGIPVAMRSMALTLARLPDASAQGESERLLGHAARRGDVVSALLLLERWRRTDPARAADLQASLHRAGHAPLPYIEATEPAWSPPSGTDALKRALSSMLQIPTPRVLCDSPRVRHVEGLLSAEECRFVIAMARPQLRPAKVYQREAERSGLAEARTSSNATLGIAHEDFHLRLLQARMACAAQAEMVQAEPLEVMRYQPGQEYRPHRDYLPPAALQSLRPEAGQRKTTLCVYLTNVEGGGGTAFPMAELEVQPRAGDAIVFENLDAQGAPDPRSLHAGRPVTHGEKWLATLWFRERNYRNF